MHPIAHLNLLNKLCLRGRGTNIEILLAAWEFSRDIGGGVPELWARLPPEVIKIVREVAIQDVLEMGDVSDEEGGAYVGISFPKSSPTFIPGSFIRQLATLPFASQADLTD